MRDSYKYTSSTNSGRPYLFTPMARMRHKRLQADPQQQMMHRRYIEDIAEETKRPVPDVASIYADVLNDLELTAEITVFLPIFAWKRVKTILKNHKS